MNTADKYKELLMDMCSKKLALNLPYMKSVLLSWFESLRNAIEQELYHEGKKNDVLGSWAMSLPKPPIDYGGKPRLKVISTVNS
ncbi:hypothetical protein L484_002568 [Morus notabilis]|uniref:Uncharacterized protein n=1 Tax=Morus notabilis TaxID=981085 RepID=W9QPV4_9ROSA|nr:hypothetical protein L484_002568 [Morus notabilis]